MFVTLVTNQRRYFGLFSLSVTTSCSIYPPFLSPPSVLSLSLSLSSFTIRMTRVHVPLCARGPDLLRLCFACPFSIYLFYGKKKKSSSSSSSSSEERRALQQQAVGVQCVIKLDATLLFTIAALERAQKRARVPHCRPRML